MSSLILWDHSFSKLPVLLVLANLQCFHSNSPLWGRNRLQVGAPYFREADERCERRRVSMRQDALSTKRIASARQYLLLPRLSSSERSAQRRMGLCPERGFSAFVWTAQAGPARRPAQIICQLLWDADFSPRCRGLAMGGCDHLLDGQSGTASSKGHYLD